MKISDLIPMLNSMMREAGDAEICVQVGGAAPRPLNSVFTALKVALPNTEERVNLVVLKVLSPE